MYHKAEGVRTILSSGFLKARQRPRVRWQRHRYILWAVYIRKCCPSKVLDGKIPMEALLGSPLDTSNLRVLQSTGAGPIRTS